MPLDRLASLIRGLSIEAVGPPPLDGATLSLRREAADFVLSTAPAPGALVAARLRWGAPAGPLWAAEAGVLRLPPSDPLHAVAGLLAAEVTAPRCGSVAVLRGYVEVLVVHLLRDRIARGPSTGVAGGGLIAGLADPRLARALVAIHDDPARPWRVEDLAVEAGMSRSAFMAAFRQVMGEAPIAYLRRWRLDRARQELRAGDRVAVVARRYGYLSADAFTRAFRQAEGCAPSTLRSA